MLKASKDKIRMVKDMIIDEDMIIRYQDQLDYQSHLLREHEIISRRYAKSQLNEKLNNIIRTADVNTLYIIDNLYEKYLESARIDPLINPRLIDSLNSRVLLIRLKMEQLNKLRKQNEEPL